MSDESRRIARAYPLRVRDIGIVGTAVVVARANWDIVEVRALSGNLLMRDEVSSQNALLFHPRMRFAGGRYLIAEVGGGISAAGFQAWDFVEQRWAMRVHDHWDDVALVGVDVARALAAVSDGKGIDVFDVARGEHVWRVPVSGVASVDFNPEDPELTVVGGDPFSFGDAEAPGAPIAATFAKSALRCRWALHESSYDGPQLAWLDRTQVVALSPAGELWLLSAELEPLRSLGHSVTNDCELRVAGARWVVLHGGDSTILIDATGREPARTIRGFATVMPGAHGIVCADTHSATAERR